MLDYFASKIHNYKENMRRPRRTKIQMQEVRGVGKEKYRLENNYYKIKAQCKTVRDIEFELTMEQYLWVMSYPCAYGNQRDGIRMTLDRMDNTKGYSIDNVCPACWYHNYKRNCDYTFEEFQDAVKRYPGLALCRNRKTQAEREQNAND